MDDIIVVKKKMNTESGSAMIVNYEQNGQLQPFNQVVLMSGSKRRHELLAFLDPVIQIAQIDERQIEATYFSQYQSEAFLPRVAKTCCEISKAKLSEARESNTLYIAADTMVVACDQIYHKPKDLEEAEQMLRSYFGQVHHVVTSVCLKTTDYLDVFYAVTEVEFVDYYPALEPLIQSYLETKSSLDKSGGYGIQEIDPRFVARIDGDIYTVVGLPVAEVSRRINTAIVK